MNETYGINDINWPQDNVNPHFVGRQKELNQLREHFEKRRGVIIITGLGGVGKTSLLRQFLSIAKTHTAPMLLPLEFGQAISTQKIADRMSELRIRKEVPEIVAIDYADAIFSGNQIAEVAGIILNYKRVKSLILVSRNVSDYSKFPIIELGPLDISASAQLMDILNSKHDLNIDSARLTDIAKGNPLFLHMLANTLRGKDINSIERFLKGEIYSLTNDFVLPQRELIEVVKPKIIMTNDTLVQRLKKDPAGVHELTPRNYEILLADLLDDMGYEVELTPATRDGGKDIMAYMDTPHGKLLCLVEAKKYRPDRTVGVGLVRELWGTFDDANASSAMMVTTSSFSKDAEVFQQRHKYQLALRDYSDVVQWIDGYKKPI